MLENSLTAQFAWVLAYKNNGPAICWASDSGKPVSECWCAQCNEARQVLPWLLKVEQLQAQREHDADRITKLEANWSKVKDELQQYVDQGDFDLDGDTMHQFLFDEFELTLIEEVEVKFIIEVSASVKRPKGEDVNEYDFSLDDVSISVADSDWDIEITDYSFTDVDEA